ncbi:hypothetical protein BU25DRAFT_146092 [Macroventuria anomochaeta]|uniref:Uncharacterized protein n=1 Tax=Macroventuria anomochaeta TaxID=301207 RepID=A0ACB6SDB1_9PLEO|nr:uncharacterized protein BU25DRAFT_146092 [Macroventuria anomochaeta]KAF2632270.1 hypothetical protein BU25DRAFT_146092 [Macroventuria anomochaeta]
MRPTKTLRAWIDNIPDNELEGGIRDHGTIWEDRPHQNFRLDSQEVIARAGEPVMYDIQVQVNNQCTISTFKKGKSVFGEFFAWILAHADDPWSAQKVRDELKATVTVFL